MITTFHKGYSVKLMTVVGVPRFQIFSVTGALMTTKVFFSIISATKFIDEVVCGERNDR